MGQNTVRDKKSCYSLKLLANQVRRSGCRRKQQKVIFRSTSKHSLRLKTLSESCNLLLQEKGLLCEAFTVTQNQKLQTLSNGKVNLIQTKCNLLMLTACPEHKSLEFRRCNVPFHLQLALDFVSHCILLGHMPIGRRRRESHQKENKWQIKKMKVRAGKCLPSRLDARSLC